jgi:hypothetical protein
LRSTRGSILRAVFVLEALGAAFVLFAGLVLFVLVMVSLPLWLPIVLLLALI